MDLTVMKALEAEEIPTIIKNAINFGGKVSQPNVKEEVSSIIKSLHLNQEGKLIIELQDELPLLEERPITVELNYRDLFFRVKANEYSVDRNQLITNVPREARALPRRECDRFSPPENHPVCAAIHRAEKRDRSSHLIGKIVDISQSGLGLNFSELREGTLVQYDHIWIRELNNSPLDKPLFGRIVYVTESKVGIAFDSLIPDERFQQLQELCQV
jgi:hypothetical protein